MTMTELLLIGAVVFVIAGTVKGVVGIGLPTAAISMLTLFIDPRMAIAVGLGPVLASNAWQIWTMGDLRDSVRRYWLFALFLGMSVFLTVTSSTQVSERVIYLAIGISIVAFSLIHLNFTMPMMPDRYDRLAQVGFGTVSGILGGLSGVWIAPIIMYLSARDLSKDEFMRASGMLLFVGSVPLVTAYVQQGFLTPEIARVSLGLVIPTLIGFALGARLRSRMSNEKFRKVLLYAFLVLGLNLLRRGIF
jgi:uncharacterized membrane protein YfcA